MEILRYQNRNNSILPHHFVDFATLVHSSLKDRDMSTQLKVLSRRLKSGISKHDILVKVPEGNKAQKQYGNWINYPTDVHGNAPSKVNKKMEIFFNKFFVGNPDELISIGLLPDGVCNSCVFGAHCQNSFEQRKRGRTYDNLYLERFAAWSQLSQIVDQDLPIKNLGTDPNFSGWFIKIISFKQLFGRDQAVITPDENGRIQKITMKRKVIVENISKLASFMSPVGACLFWINKDINLLARNREIIVQFISDSNYEEILNIVSDIQSLDKKIT